MSLTNAQVAKICTIDAPRLSTQVKEYVTANQDQYRILIECWSLLCSEINDVLPHQLEQYLLRFGLIDTIKDCDKCAASLVHGTRELPSWLAWCDSDLVDLDTVLQLLRFPKRFSPLKADIVANEGIKNFIMLNNEVKMFQRKEIPYWITSHLKAIVEEILANYQVSETDEGSFSSGVTANNNKPLRDKIREYGSVKPFFDSPLYPISANVDWSGHRYHNHQYSSVIMAVPKNYKTPRIIGKEPAYRQYHMQARRKALTKALTPRRCMLDLSDQGMSREKCRYAAKFGRYASIDLSSASDRISKSLYRSIFPLDVIRDFDTLLSDEFSIGTKYYTMQMFSTSGSALTFVLESIVFLAIALLAYRIHGLFTNYEDNCEIPCIYGDDMLVDTNTFDLTCELLTACGLVVNTDKSFAEGRYRESCGVEYYGDQETTTIYWPRKPISLDSAESIQSLISLQHKCHEITISGKTAYKASWYLSTVVRSVIPRMTSSPIGTECDDLWELVPIFDEVYPPHKKGTLVPEDIKRERHYTLSQVYDTKVPLKDTRALEMYKYYTFLREGPTYSDPLSKLLNVTEAHDLRQDCLLPEPKWILTIR